LLSVQGPRSDAAVQALGSFPHRPARALDVLTVSDPMLGEMVLANQPRLATQGFDLFVPAASMGAVADKLIAAARSVGGRPCGWRALEVARVEAGIPRFGVDMDDRNLPPECGIEERAVSYQKGCYIGQEVINRLHTMGHVVRKLCGLKLADAIPASPVRDDKLFSGDKEVGYVTSAVTSPSLGNIALGYVRSECNQTGTILTLHGPRIDTAAKLVELPFRREL